MALTLCLLVASLGAAGPQQSKSSKKPAQRKTAVHSVSTRSSRSRNTQRAHVTRTPPAPSYQLHPDPDRYQEIQKALAERGYFQGDTNGVWGDDSVDAVKRFQTDQKIEPDGKINALTLIGLGLGPKHSVNGATSTPASEAPPSTPSAAKPDSPQSPGTILPY